MLSPVMPMAPSPRCVAHSMTGWANHRIFEDDDFDSLKGDPEFEAILEEVRSRL